MNSADEQRRLHSTPSPAVARIESALSRLAVAAAMKEILDRVAGLATTAMFEGDMVRALAMKDVVGILAERIIECATPLQAGGQRA